MGVRGLLVRWIMPAFAVALACMPAHAGLWSNLVGRFKPTPQVQVQVQTQQPQNKVFSTDPESQIKPRELMLGLPASVQAWHRAETILLSRKVDSSRLMSPERNSQNPLFTPEAGNVFEIYGFWINAGQMKIYSSQIPKELQQTFFRVHNNRQQILFLVHPESYVFYSSRLDLNSLDKEVFFATSTASSRSLIVWKPGQESKPFVAKVSLDAEIAGVNRTVKGVEAALSVGTDQILSVAKDLPSNFAVFHEVLSAIPKDMDRGAMIIRTIPEEILQGRGTYIPFFAIYAQPLGGEKPLLLKWLQETNEDPRSFVEKRLIQPFIRQWVRLAIEDGILTEPHAQNVLVGLGPDGMPIDKFMHRDFGGFNIDIEYRRSIGQEIPMLPVFTGSVANDYYQKAHKQNYSNSLNSYFDAGFMHSVEAAIMKWTSEGLIRSGIQRGDLMKVTIKELNDQIRRYSKGAPLARTYYDLPLIMPNVRKAFQSSIKAPVRTCEAIFE